MIKKYISLLLCICLGITSASGAVWAREEEEESFFQGENREALEHVTGVDEEGNVIEAEDDGEEDTVIGRNPLTLEEGGQLVNFRTKSSSSVVTNYTDAVTGENGYTNGYYGADAAYLGMENGMVKFMLSGVTGLVSPSEVTIVNVDEASSISHYEVSGGRLIHRITTNLAGTSYLSNLDNGEAPDYLRSGADYYSYDGHYFYTFEDFEYMLSDYRSGTREHSVNASDPFFNYFQYLPLRSVSNYSAARMNDIINSRVSTGSKLREAGQLMVQAQDRYGINALLIAGIAANESAWGTSSISQSKNNLFGINAVDSSPGESADTFSSVAVCIEEYAQYFLSEQYLNPDNWKYSGGFLGNKASGLNVRYASDPYWGEKAAALAWSVNLTGGGEDSYVYTIGIKDILPEQTDLNVRADATTSSRAVYSTGEWPCYAFVILDSAPVSGFYRVQSDPALTDSRTDLEISARGNYQYETMYLYASSSYIDLVYRGSGDVPQISGVSFTDVSLDSWFYDYVKYIDDQEIMTGLNWYTFGPGENMARAQFALILYRMAGEPAVSDQTGTAFKDVGETWYTDAVKWASVAGIVTGYSNGCFGPGDNLNREQMVTMLYRYMQYMGYDTATSGSLGAFPDAAWVSDYAEDAIKWAIGLNIIQGDNGQIKPQDTVVRAVGATIITRFIKNIL